MKKKMIAGAMVAAAVALGSMTAFAAGIEKVDIDGITFEIPEEIRDLVTVQTQLGSEDEIVMVSETASRDAALAMEDEDVEYAGWLFTITKMREEDVEKLRCGGMEGMNVFAEDDDIYYVFNHPTDVRFVREQYEDIDADMEQWNLVNEWAGTVCDEILGNNPELDGFLSATPIWICILQRSRSGRTSRSSLSPWSLGNLIRPRSRKTITSMT